jgi:hypothetical protein
MVSSEKYRRRAEERIDLAERASSKEVRQTLLNMAKTWLQLAATTRKSERAEAELTDIV